MLIKSNFNKFYYITDVKELPKYENIKRVCDLCLKTTRGFEYKYCPEHDENDKYVIPKEFGVSRKSCEFLDILENYLNIKIKRTLLDKEKWTLYNNEHQINGTFYRVDGYIEEKKIVIEFLGDYWHGNPKRFISSHINFSTKEKKTFGELYKSTMERLTKIKNMGYIIFYTWESDFDEWKKKKTKCRKDFLNLLIKF